MILPWFTGGGRHFYYNRVFPQRYMQYSAIRPSGMRTAAGSRHHRGFHLFEADERLVRTIDYLKCCGAEQIYPCHCVSLRAKARMMEALNVKEVGVGMELCLDGQAAH